MLNLQLFYKDFHFKIFPFFSFNFKNNDGKKMSI